MEPRPDVVFFMTDGKTSENSVNKTIELVKALPPGSVQINTVALGVSEKDMGGLRTVAEMTEGNFRHYDSKQLKEVEQQLPDDPAVFEDYDLTYLHPAEVRTVMTSNQQQLPPVKEEDLVEFDL